MEKKYLDITERKLLLKKFNNREPNAFGEIYNIFYRDFHFYLCNIFENNSESDDIIQDIFLELWQKRNLQFDELIKIKAFVIISIKNRYKNYLRHLKYKKEYAKIMNKEDDFKFEVIESELYSIVNEAIGLLPNECGKIFRLYLEGWKPEEIVAKTGKKQQAVYNYKQEAITVLRKKLSKDKLLILFAILH